MVCSSGPEGLRLSPLLMVLVDGGYTASPQRTLALSLFSTSQPLLCEQLCSIMDSHHDALPHHRPPNNTTERPSAGASETVSQKCPWFSRSFPRQQKTNTALSITKLRTPEQVCLRGPNLCSAERKKAARKKGCGRATWENGSSATKGQEAPEYHR